MGTIPFMFRLLLAVALAVAIAQYVGGKVSAQIATLAHRVAS